MHLGEQRVGMGEDAKLEQADAHGVERARAGHGFEAGAVVGVDEELVELDALAAGEGREEAPALLLGEGGVVVRAGEVGEDTGQPQVRGRGDLGVERGRLFVPHAEPAHTGVDFQVHGDGPAGGAADGVEALHLVGGGDRGGEIVVGEVVILLGQQRAEQEDGPAGSEFAHGGRLGERRHGKEVGAGVHEPRDGLVQAVAIGVGLHHGDIADMRRQGGTDEAQVAFQGREIDLGPATERQAGVGGVHGAR